MKFKLFVVFTCLALLWHAYRPQHKISDKAIARGLLFPSESGAYDFLKPKPIDEALIDATVEIELKYFEAEGMMPVKWPKLFRAYHVKTMYMSCEADQANWGSDFCDGITFMPGSNEIETYVRASEDDCITHTSLAHEIGHILLGGDHDHENEKFWGYSPGAILGKAYKDLEQIYCPAFKGEDDFYKRHSVWDTKGKKK